MKKDMIVAVLTVLLCTSLSSAEKVYTLTLTNPGPNPAYDYHIILYKHEKVNNIYRGRTVLNILPYEGIFQTTWWKHTRDGSNNKITEIIYDNFVDGTAYPTNTRIDVGQTIVVAYTTNSSSSVKDMYWSDRSGQRIRGSRVAQIWSKSTFQSGLVGASFKNEFKPDSFPAMPIAISNVKYALLRNPLLPEKINSSNDSLAALMVALPGGEAFTVQPDSTEHLTTNQSPNGYRCIVMSYIVNGTAEAFTQSTFADVIISPATGSYLSTQTFDLALLIPISSDITAVSGSFFLDSMDVSSFVLPMVQIGPLVEGGIFVKIPNIAMSSIGTPGTSHTFKATIIFSDGTSASDEVEWSIW